SGTVAFLKDLHQKGCKLYGCTSRELDKWYATETRELNKWYPTETNGVAALTIAQLEAIKIRFSELKEFFGSDVSIPQFFQGVFFADKDKGEFLYNLFTKHVTEDVQEDIQVVFLDDKLEAVELVDRALTKLGIAHICYHYRAAEQWPFDLTTANARF